MWQVVRKSKGTLQSSVAERENVRPIEDKHQEHIGCPRPDAAQSAQLFDRLVVR